MHRYVFFFFFFFVGFVAMAYFPFRGWILRQG